MFFSWEIVQAVVKTVSEILTAGIAITAFSLLLYSFQFNLRDRVARSFSLILICIVIVYTSEAIGGAMTDVRSTNFWLRVEWVGIILLPATYLHFSDALLATTGLPIRRFWYWTVRFNYLVAFLFLAALPFPGFFASSTVEAQPIPYFLPSWITVIFAFYYLLVIIASWINFINAYRRAITPTSRRRIGYLLAGSLAPALGSFPYMVFGFSLALRHQFLFWFSAMISNLFVGALIVVMAYSVAFFGVSWPDRVVKRRLFKWILRGPVTASLTLGLVTIVRRIGESFGFPYSAVVPIVMVGSILICEFSIGLFASIFEKNLFYGKDRDDLLVMEAIEAKFLTQNDLRQILEMILAAICDRLQAPGAYIMVKNPNNLELIVTIGKQAFEEDLIPGELQSVVIKNGMTPGVFRWGNEILIPLMDGSQHNGIEKYGLLGVTGITSTTMEPEQIKALELLAKRASIVLHDRFSQQRIFQSLQELGPETELIQKMRFAGRYDERNVLQGDETNLPEDLAQWVKEALNHYWGGPRLTESPLMRLKIVREALVEHDGNATNALRSILREAITRVKPEGDRRFTGEWILYNILEMKFMEGKKVREIAMRLAMSEADLYRKQRIAIDAVAKEIIAMEEQALLEEE